MTHKESEGLNGRFKLKLYDEDGNLKDSREIKNTIVNDGLVETAGLLVGVTPTDGDLIAFDSIGIGEGSASVTATDTDLTTSIRREAATPSLTQTSVSEDTAELVNTFNFTASHAIRESGVFNTGSADTGGDMLCRQTFPVMNVTNGDSLETTWDIQVS